MVGYRAYDTQQTDVNFCFGHGLSYTTFAYRRLKIVSLKQAVKEEALQQPEGKTGISSEMPLFEVSLLVRNSGVRPGKEIVQIYTAPVDDSAERPAHELRAFEKLMLAPGEEREVKFVLTERDFSSYDETQKAFLLQSGVYEIQAAASSREIRLRAEVRI